MRNTSKTFVNETKRCRKIKEKNYQISVLGIFNRCTDVFCNRTVAFRNKTPDAFCNEPSSHLVVK